MIDKIELYNLLLLILFIISPIVFLSLMYFKAPYGRYIQKKWGPNISNRSGWILMEGPAVFIMLFLFISSNPSPIAYVFFALWQIHYINRTFIYPFRLKNPFHPIPLLIPLLGALFNLINGYINGVSLTIIHSYDISWLFEPRFLLGILLFLVGFIINQQSDRILLNLRKSDISEYSIPYGGLFRWISCPNYLGEIIEWIGWALATWSLAGLAFAIFTIANLLPRALSHHHWYHQKFPNYPKNRRAIV